MGRIIQLFNNVKGLPVLRIRAVCFIMVGLAVLMMSIPLGVPEVSVHPKLIAFTYDDGPSSVTKTLLDGLKERNAYATFFMTGLLDVRHGLENHTATVDRMVREGHQLANHSYYHIKMKESTPANVKTQIKHTEKLLFKHMGGVYIDMFRPPNGKISVEQRKMLDIPVILWNLDSFDWKYINADIVYKNIVNGAADGMIIDIHDLSPTSVEGSLRAVDTLKKQGYEFVTVAELLRRRGITPKSGEIYSSAPNKGINLPAYQIPAVNCTWGKQEEKITVTLSTGDTGVTLYYTTDGSYPTLASSRYEGPFKITKDTILTVVGYDEWATRTPTAVRKVTGSQISISNTGS